MKKRGLVTVLLVCVLATILAVGAYAASINSFDDATIDSLVGTKIIDFETKVTTRLSEGTDRERVETLNPYNSSYDYYNKNPQCVEYVWGRIQDRLNVRPNWSSGNGKDCAPNAKSKDNTYLTSPTGKQYLVKFYNNDNGENIKANSMVSFGAVSGNPYGHVIYVEHVKKENGTTYVYYTHGGVSIHEEGNSGKLFKKTLSNLLSTWGAYQGVVCFENEESSPIPSSWGISSFISVKEGSKGQAVKALQIALNRVMNAGLDEDGVCGTNTVNAIKNFQKKYGLSVDGVCGISTWAKLAAVFNEVSSSTSTPVQPKTVPGSMTSSSNKSEYTTNEDIVIQWTTASGATEYGLTIKRDGDNWTAYDTAPGRRLTGNSANIGKLPAGTYRFNMCPYNSVGGGAVSELKRFTVKEAHTHSYTGSYYESAHPHKEYQLCTCGEKRYTGNTRKDESCKICNPVVYTVYYNANGGSGAPAPQTHGENENVRLSSQTPTRDGYIFKGWAGSENGTVEMMPGDLCGYNYNVTFYAVWEKEQPKTVTLAFNAGGGIEPPSPRTVNAGTLVNIPGETPNRTGYRFMGWTDAAGSTTVKYEIGDVIRVSSDITLYAVWSSRTQLTLTIGNNWATVNGNQVYNDVAPLIVNDRTMLPARFVAENLGAKVEWVDRTQCVNITGSDNTYIQIFIGSATAYVDGEARYLDSPAFIRNDRTYTPVRFICEALGAEVGWNEALEQVNIIK